MTQAVVTAQNGGADYSGTFRNKIINGDMRFDQRNAGASVTSPNGYQTVDRWKFYIANGSKFNAQQVTDAPAGFTNSLKLTSSSSYTLTSTDFYSLVHAIEGYNVADLAFGTSSAKTVTLSFWVKSSLTGVFGGNIGNGARNRQYFFTYTISTANTWTYITLSIPGDTSGTWATDYTTGMLLEFGLGAGTATSSSAGSWVTSGAYSATGAVSLVSTNNATIQFTGVQLEVGTQATPFERRPYGVELQLCQRYYWQLTSNSITEFFFQGYHYATTQLEGIVTFPVAMRVSPSISTSPASQFSLRLSGNALINLWGYTAGRIGPPTEMLLYTNNSATATAGYAQSVVSNSATTTYIGFSSEL